MSDDIARRFSDEQARTILARAIEIDSRAPMTTTDDLRAIAAEIGLSQASLDAALREQTTALDARRMIGGQRAATALVASGVPMGLAAGFLLMSGGTGLAALSLMAVGLVASGGLVVLQGATGTLRSFHLKNLALWTGVAAGSLAAMVLSGGEITRLPALITAGWCLRSWVASSIVGSAAVVAVRRARPEGPGPDRNVTETSERTGDGRWARVAKRALRRITGSLRWDAGRVLFARRRFNVAR
jgi:hypothetical protein